MWPITNGMPASDEMMRADDIAYHLRREAQERAAGFAATDVRIGRVHLDLAERHAARVRQHQAWSDQLDGKDGDLEKHGVSTDQR